MQDADMKNPVVQSSSVINEDTTQNSEKAIPKDDDTAETSMLDHIKNTPAIFQSQQIGDPELTIPVKRKIAEELLHKNPVSFLVKFGEFLEEDHLNYFLEKYKTYEVEYYVKKLKHLLSDHNKKIMRRNRRYEAMKRLEAEGSYFSEKEMEKREPLLYHQMVGQFLSEKEKLIKSREDREELIPTFSTFLIEKMERDELNRLVKFQQEEEDGSGLKESSSEEEEDDDNIDKGKPWGADWEENKESTKKKVKRKIPKNQTKEISVKEKGLLLQEFKSIMQNKFLNGNDCEFNYSEVDYNPDFDSIELRTQDEEEKYFDEETYDGTVCTDTGIEDY